MSNDSRSQYPQKDYDTSAAISPIKGESIWVNRYQNVSSATVQGPMELGTQFGPTREGKCYRLVMNNTATAFAAGSILTPSAIVAATGSAAVTAGTLNKITGVSGLKVGEWAGGYAYMSAATGTGADGQIARVTWNTATEIYLDRNMVAATSATVQLWHPWKMRLAPTGITGHVTGVSVGTVSAATGSGMFVAGGVSYFGWMQTKGLCDRVLVTAAPFGSGLLSGALTASASVAGSADPITADESMDDYKPFAYAVEGFAFDVAVPAYLYCE